MQLRTTVNISEYSIISMPTAVYLTAVFTPYTA